MNKRKFKPFCKYTRDGLVRDYIREGLRKYDAPSVILERIERALQDSSQLTQEEIAELQKQKDKIEPIAKMMF